MRTSLLGVTMVVLSAVCFSAKAIFAKLAYRLGADASTVLTLRMAFALPFFFAAAVTAGAEHRKTDARGSNAIPCEPPQKPQKAD